LAVWWAAALLAGVQSHCLVVAGATWVGERGGKSFGREREEKKKIENGEINSHAFLSFYFLFFFFKKKNKKIACRMLIRSINPPDT
jgi:hypothetical protein